MTEPSLRALLASGKPALGTWISIPAPHVAEIVASVGFDWICVDMQHGFVGEELLPTTLLAAERAHVPVLVRTRWNDPAAIMRALDAGAEGVIVPLVNTAEEAAAAARACRYPPAGIRSWGPMRPVRAGAPVANAVGEPLCVVMVETTQAVGNATAIASTPGVDGVFVGPSDLSLSVSGDLGTDLTTAAATVASACAAAGVSAGMACGGAESAASAHAAGFQLLTLQWDVAMLAAGAADALSSASAAIAAVQVEPGD